MIINCKIVDNRAQDRGGGVYTRFTSTLTVTDSVIAGNSAYVGGGVRNDGGTMLIANSIISGNSTEATLFGGSGIVNINHGTAIVIGSTIFGNSGPGCGGGIFNSNASTLTIVDSTLSNNSVLNDIRDGGGIYNSSNSTLTIINSTISRNSAGRLGGGIVLSGGSGVNTVEIVSCTFTENSAATGGGIHNSNSSDTTVNIRNTIVAANTAANNTHDVCGLFAFSVNNLIGVIDGSTGLEDTDTIYGTAASPLDPMLGPLADNGGPTQTHALLSGSSAIDAGSNIYALNPDGNPLIKDQRGLVRIFNAVVDIGAYEFCSLIYVDDDAPGDQGSGDPDVSDPLEDGSEDHPFDSIQEGIDAVSEGMMVFVKSGTYNENTYIDKDLHLIGENALTTTIDAGGIGKAVYIDNISGVSVEIRNLTITNSGIGYDNNVANAGVVFHTWGNGELDIQNCIIENNGQIGIIVGGPATIQNNLIVHNGENPIANFHSGIFVTQGGSAQIVNNTISGNNQGISIHWQATQAVLLNNIISENQYGVSQLGAGPTVTSDYNNYWANLYNNSGFVLGQHDIQSEPLFVSPSGGDYHLLPGSPSIDTGNPTSDFSLEPQPNGGRINMGAYGNTPEATTSEYVDSDNDGVLTIEEQGPDGTDLNFDGNSDSIPDSLQDNAASCHAVTGDYVTIVCPDDVVLNNVEAVDNPSPVDIPAGVEMPYGFFEFVVKDVGVGGATTVNIHVPDGSLVNSYYRYGPTPDNPTDHWYEFLYDGQTGAQINGNVITLHFVDGLRGDDDITANGIVVEPGGPAMVSGPEPVDDLVSVSYGSSRYNRRTGQFSVDVTITNTSDTAIGGPIWLAIEDISDPSITLDNSDGITSDGKLYINLSNYLNDGRLNPGESVTTRLYFNNPNRLRFIIQASVRGVILP